MVSNVIIQCFFTLLLNVLKDELKWIHVCTASISFLKRSQKWRRCFPRGVPPFYSQMCSQFRSRASVVRVMAGLRAGRSRVRGSFPACARNLPFLQNVQTDLELHSVPYPVGTDICSPGADWSRPSPLSSVEVKNAWIITSISSCVFLLLCWFKHGDILILYKYIKHI